jgi:hypothetical protein
LRHEWGKEEGIIDLNPQLITPGETWVRRWVMSGVASLKKIIGGRVMDHGGD